MIYYYPFFVEWLPQLYVIVLLIIFSHQPKNTILSPSTNRSEINPHHTPPHPPNLPNKFLLHPKIPINIMQPKYSLRVKRFSTMMDDLSTSKHKKQRSRTISLFSPCPSLLQDQFINLKSNHFSSISTNKTMNKNHNTKSTIFDKYHFALPRKSEVTGIKQKMLNFVYVFNGSIKPSNTPPTIKNQLEHRSSNNEIWEDQGMLAEDYKEDMKADKNKQIKTIAELNNSLINKYKELVDHSSVATQQQHCKLLKFKKQPKVVNIVLKKQILLQKQRRVRKNPYPKVLDFQKDDYCIFSRSVNKAINHKYEKKGQSDKMVDKCMSVPDQAATKGLKMEKTFYKCYMSSYSERKRILLHSEIMLKE